MRRWLFALALIAAALAHVGRALADVHVSKGQVVNEIRVIGQDVRVDGRARGPVIVVGGTLDVGPTGQVKNVTVVGGKIVTAPGARLEGDVYQVGGPISPIEGWRLVIVVLVFLALRPLFAWLGVSAAGLLARSSRLLALSERVDERPLRTTLVGALAASGLAALSVLLAITVFGLPLAVAIWGLLLLSTVVGTALALNRLDDEPHARRLVMIVLVIPIVGDALAALATVVGLGALLSQAARPRPSRVETTPRWS